MLRRKLLLIFGSLVAFLVVLAVAAVWVLQGMLHRLDHLNTEALSIVQQSDRLNAALTSVEIELYQLQLGRKRHLDALIESTRLVGELSRQLGEHYVVRKPAAQEHYRKLVERYPQFQRRVGLLATAQDPMLTPRYNKAAIEEVLALRQNVGWIDAYARSHARTEQEQLSRHFRWLVLGITIGCLLAVNVAILVLLRAAAMVLRPVDRLVEASRQLAHDRFDHRARWDQNDEFSELAQTYNRLAERIQAAEKQRMETLAQVALTLNHELNNAMATIELQLQVLGRESGGRGRFETALRQIRENLRRMVETVESLKHIRRVVLTDYVKGVKMLDLRRSVEGGADGQDDLVGAETGRDP